MTYQGYDINKYTFYTVSQDKKNIYQNNGVHIDAYNNSMQRGTYYSQIEKIWELNYLGFKVVLFQCHWVHGAKGVTNDKYGFTSVDLKHVGYKSEPFVLAKDVCQVFYATDTTKKKHHVVLTGKRRTICYCNRATPFAE